jgi:hypothetical protein
LNIIILHHSISFHIINLNYTDEFENHFGDQQKRQQILNNKVTMIEQKQWKLINYENAALNLVSKYILNDNNEKGDNESDQSNIESLKVIYRLIMKNFNLSCVLNCLYVDQAKVIRNLEKS